MPELCRFYGIIIAMYYRDHAPAHFHAIYGEYEATVDLGMGTVRGYLPARALQHVQEWRLLHEQELMGAWVLARRQQPLPNLSPLE